MSDDREQPSGESDFSSSVVNLPESLVRLGGDRSLLMELVEIFLEDAPELLAGIAEAVKGRNAEEYSGLAHRLRGLAANFSAHQCLNAAWELEKHGRSGQDLIPVRLLEDLRAETKAVQSELEKYRTFSRPL